MRKVVCPNFYTILGNRYPSFKKPIKPGSLKGESKKAYTSWLSQRSRRKVDYASREFISWWLMEVKKKKFKKPTVGRLDHSKHYFWGNVEIQEASDNLGERNTRVCSKKVLIFKDGELVKKCKSIREAAKFCGCAPNNIPAVCKGTRKSLAGYVFKYA